MMDLVNKALFKHVDLDAFLEDDAERYREFLLWMERVEALGEEFGLEMVPQNIELRIAILDHARDDGRPDEDIPAGWTRLKTKPGIQPNRRTPKGREIDARLKALAKAGHNTLQVQRLYTSWGVPMIAETTESPRWRSLRPGYHLVGGTENPLMFVVVFGSSKVTWDGGEWFERIPVSEYLEACAVEEARKESEPQEVEA